MADPIEAYLDQLLGHLRGSAHDVRRILSEAEEHLRDATAEVVAAGTSEEEAQQQAIQRFGSPRAVARRFSARLAPVPPAAVAAELVGRLLGAGFVAGDLPGMTYTPQRCAEFLEYFPDAGGCERAAALHHWGEVVEYRVAAGVLGLAVLGGYLLWRRGRRDEPPRYLGALPDGLAATVAAGLYGLAAGVLALEGLNTLLAGGGSGAGQWLSAAVIALVMAVLYGVSLYRTMLNRARLDPATSQVGRAERSSS